MGEDKWPKVTVYFSCLYLTSNAFNVPMYRVMKLGRPQDNCRIIENTNSILRGVVRSWEASLTLYEAVFNF
jgi:hypothetical protein